MGNTLSTSVVWNREDSADEADDFTCSIARGTEQTDLLSMPFEMGERSAMPERKTSDAAGFDICSSEAVTLEAGCGWKTVHTGLKIGIGVPTVKQRLGAETIVYGAIRGRSGLTRAGVEVFDGTIDADFTGEICILAKNTTSDPFEISKGDRIAQLIFSIALVPQLYQVDALSSCFESERGSSGFGSTGINEKDNVYPAENA
jgi:dUTP pyrophosphatase